MSPSDVLGMALKFILPLVVTVGLARYLIQSKVARSKIGVNWDGFDAISLTLALYFGSQVVAGLIFIIYAGLTRPSLQQVMDKSKTSNSLQFIGMLLIYASIVVGLGLLLKRRQRTLKDLGLRRPEARDALFAVIGVMLYLPLTTLVMSLARVLLHNLNFDQEQQLGFTDPSGKSLILVFIGLVVLAPFAEELMCRGFLYLGLKNSVPKKVAIILTSLIFALGHLQFSSGAPLLWTAAIDTFMLSLFLIYIRDKTNALWAPVALHMSKNLIAFSLLYLSHK